MKNISIIIPAYKEKENIFNLTKKILNLYPKVTIFIIDDTENLNLKNRFRHNKIKYFYRGNKRGRGSAVLYGLKKSLSYKSNSIFIEMDADFSHNPKELKKNIEYFKSNNSDLLIASRYLKNSQILNWSFGRRILSKLSNRLARTLLNVKLNDFTNGFRIYSTRATERITKTCGNIGDGFIILSEIIIVIKNNSFKIDEIETIFVNRSRGESSVNMKLILASLYGIFKLYFIKNRLN